MKDKIKTEGKQWEKGDNEKIIAQMSPKLMSPKLSRQQCSDSESRAQLKPYLHSSWQTSKHQRQGKGLKSYQRQRQITYREIICRVISVSSTTIKIRRPCNLQRTERNQLSIKQFNYLSIQRAK